MSKLLRFTSILFFLVWMPMLTRAQCTVNAGADYSRCIYTSDSIVIHGAVTGDFTTYSWTTSGTGVVAKSTTLNPEYFHNQEDITNGSVTLTLTASGGICGFMTDQIIITLHKFPTVVLQNEFTFCGSEVVLTSASTGASSLQWSAIVGTGSFSTTTSANTIFSASVEDRTRGYILVTLSGSAPASQCTNSDTVRVNIVSVAIVDSGPDRTVCSAPHSGTFPIPNNTTGYTTYLWTTSGSGTFLNKDAFSTAYFLSEADKLSGSVTITLTGSSATCGTASDSYTITVLPAPVVSAGIDQTICSNTTMLSGTVTPATATLEWLNVIGTGTITNSATLTPTYTVSEEDKIRGYALVRLVAISTEGCRKEDTVRLDLFSHPIVSAGANKLSCVGSVPLTGYALNAASKTWTTTGTGTFANSNKDTTTYLPSAADRNLGELILTYTGTTVCSTMSSTMKIDFIESTHPQVDAGADATVCVNDTIKLFGSVVDATGGTWTTNGSGKFLASASHLINRYIPSSADKTAGTVVFTLTTYSNGGCGSVSHAKTVTIALGLMPYANAGADQISSISTQLNASVSNASLYLWQTSGTGIFLPNPTSMNPSYIPSAGDRAAGSAVLTLVATGTCSFASDAMTLFTATPSSLKGTVKAGSNTLDRGVVYLFLINGTVSRTLVGIDTLLQSDNGLYEFASVPQGNYSVYAVPLTSSTFASTHLATYYGNSAATEWEIAGLEEVENNSAAHVLNIDLVAYTSAMADWNTGKDTIAGAVFLNTPLQIMRLAGNDDLPLSGVVVFLKTLNGQIIAYTSTDKYGAYAFNNVREGNYFIDSEYSGTEIILADKIVAVDGDSKTIEDGNVIVIRTSVKTGVASPKKSIQLNAYPNPVTDIVHIKLSNVGTYKVNVLDEVGTMYIEKQLLVTSGGVVDISLAELTKGLYIIQITSDEELYTTKIVKF